MERLNDKSNVNATKIVMINSKNSKKTKENFLSQNYE